jgi:hypothetical protein
MARYQIDGVINNVPSGANFVDITARSSSGESGFGSYNAADGSFTVQIDNSESTDSVWLTIDAQDADPMQGTTTYLAIKTVGPYVMSDVGVVVP